VATFPGATHAAIKARVEVLGVDALSGTFPGATRAAIKARVEVLGVDALSGTFPGATHAAIKARVEALGATVTSTTTDDEHRPRGAEDSTHGCSVHLVPSFCWLLFLIVP
jgi:hypothetical protein